MRCNEMRYHVMASHHLMYENVLALNAVIHLSTLATGQA